MSDKASLMQQTAPLTAVGLQRELAVLFVKALNLEVQPDDIDPDAPLFIDFDEHVRGYEGTDRQPVYIRQ